MVVPLRDINVRHSFPIVTVSLIVTNCLAFLYELSLGPALERFFQSAAFVPARYFEPGGWVADNRSVLVAMFLHGGWAHLLGNMLYLWIFGDNVEDRLGRARYLLFYLFCGWVATLVHAYSNPHSTVPSIGASGAIAGVLGAYLVMFPRARVLTLIPIGFFIRIAELPAILVLGFWFAIQLFSGTMALGAQTAQRAGVAWWAHIGGFAAGLLLGLLFRGRGRDRDVPRRRPPRHLAFLLSLLAFLFVLGLLASSARAQIVVPERQHTTLTVDLHAVLDDVTLYRGDPQALARINVRPGSVLPRVESTTAAQAGLLRIRDITLYDAPPVTEGTYIDGDLYIEEAEEARPQRQKWTVELSPAGPTTFLLECEKGSGTFDFSGFEVEEAYILGDSTVFEITFSRPNPIGLKRFKLTNTSASLRFENVLNARARSMTLQLAGVDTEIDITGKPFPGEIQLYLEEIPSRLRLRVAKKIGLRVAGPSRSVAPFDAPGMERDGASLQTVGYTDRNCRVRLHIASEIPDLEVEWD